MKSLRNAYLIGVAILPIILSGCATTLSPAGRQVQVADTDMVSECAFLGNVQGSSGWGSLAASTGMQNARNEAREKAAKMGATHIVWANVEGGYSPSAFGKAYRCE